MRHLFRHLVLVVLGCLVTSCVVAQTAQIQGQVTDPQKAVLPNADVRVVNQATSVERKTKTNDAGMFSFPFLEPGHYKITVQAQGFNTAISDDLIINVGQTLVSNFELKVGATTQSVTVTAEGSNLNTTDGSVSTVVDRQFVANMPLNGRSFQSLVTLTPGVVLTKGAELSPGQFSVNGQRGDANYFMVDGVSANFSTSDTTALSQTAGGSLPSVAVTGGFNNLVSVDALQEFRIQTSSYAPEFGRTPGAQISFVSRSGTNEFHGTLFDYFRNDVLDANNWFANHSGLPKPKERQNDFGVVLGGPIIKDKTFFFFSYEGLRLRQPQAKTVLVPSLAARQAAAPAVQPLLNSFPLPNGTIFPDGTATFAASYSDPSTLDAASIRVDHTIGRALTLFGRYNYAPSENTQRGIFAGSLATLSPNDLNTQTLTAGGTYLIRALISDEFRFNWSRNDAVITFKPDNLGGAVPPSDSQVFPNPFSSRNGFFEMTFLNGTPYGMIIGKSGNNIQRQINIVNNLSSVKGVHQLKFGMDYRRLLPTNGPRDYDQLIFWGGTTGSSSPTSGIAFLALVRSFEEVSSVYHNLSFYGQDTWRIRPQLAITYGVRWEVNPAPHGTDGKELFSARGLDNLSQLALAPAGVPLYRTTYNNFAPRIGVAYQLRQREGWGTVVRGGFGVFYDLGTGTIGNAASGFPHAASRTLINAAYPLTSAQSTPPPFVLSPISGSLYVTDPNLKLPKSYQWNVAIEQGLGASQTLSASYVAALGRRLLRTEGLRTPTGANIFLTENTATADYHALQVQLRRRLQRGLQALASYTWSHSIDIASDDVSGSSPASYINPGIDRGSSSFDIRQALDAALTYNVPRTRAGGISNLFGNWAIDTIILAHSATPVNLSKGSRVVGSFVVPLRPDVVPGIPFYLFGSQYPGGKAFNPAAFQAAVGQQGNLGRNALRGFPAWQLDWAVRRQIKLTDRLSVQFRAEFFNIFNHPNFGDPTGNINSSLFGLSTQTLGQSLGTGGTGGGFNPLYQVGGPRSVQLALKVLF